MFFKKLKNQNLFNLKIFGVFFNDELISAILILEKNIYIHTLLSASKSSMMKFGGNNYLRYFTSLFYLQKNYKYIIYGGGRSVESNDSLLNYKKSFSPEALDFYIATSVVNKRNLSKMYK